MNKATGRIAADFPPHLAAAVPYRIHRVRTDDGTHFTDRPTPSRVLDDGCAGIDNNIAGRA